MYLNLQILCNNCKFYNSNNNIMIIIIITIIIRFTINNSNKHNSLQTSKLLEIKINNNINKYLISKHEKDQSQNQHRIPIRHLLHSHPHQTQKKNPHQTQNHNRRPTQHHKQRNHHPNKQLINLLKYPKVGLIRSLNHFHNLCPNLSQLRDQIQNRFHILTLNRIQIRADRIRHNHNHHLQTQMLQIHKFKFTSNCNLLLLYHLLIHQNQLTHLLNNKTSNY